MNKVLLEDMKVDIGPDPQKIVVSLSKNIFRFVLTGRKREKVTYGAGMIPVLVHTQFFYFFRYIFDTHRL